MSHYEQRLQHDLDRLHERIQKLGRQAEEAVRAAVRALLKFDFELATDTVIGDLEINRGSRRIDHLCHAFVARHLPSAGNLRYVSSAMRIGHILERIGDYAETICRTVLQLSTAPPESLSRDFELLSDQSLRIYHQALKAFSTRNADQARVTLEMSSQFRKTVDHTFNDIVQEGERSSRPVADVLAFLACFNRLQRIIHQAKNICEETIFVETGQKKRSKRFNFLFVSERNDGPGQLAEALGQKIYEHAGTFQSTGWDPAERLDAAFVAFAANSGVDLQEARPKAFEDIDADLDDFDIIIDFSGRGREYWPRLPYHTIMLHWPLEQQDTPEDIYKRISIELESLMIRLYGEEDE